MQTNRKDRQTDSRRDKHTVVWRDRQTEQPIVEKTDR